MRHMRAPLWLRKAFLFVLVSSVGCPPVVIKAQSGDEAEIRGLIARFFAAYKEEDLDGFVSLWSVQSRGFAAARQTFQQICAASDKIELKSLVFRRIALEGDNATVRIVFDLTAVDAKTGGAAEGFGKKNWTMYLVKEVGIV